MHYNPKGYNLIKFLTMFDLITRDFSNHFDSLMKAFDNDFFEGFNVESPSFEDKGDFFELRIPVEKSVQVSNVKVRVENTLTHPVVTVAYAQRTKTSQSTYALQETLPEKANPETLKAVLDDDGNLVVTAVKKVEEKKPNSRAIPIEKV